MGHVGALPASRDRAVAASEEWRDIEGFPSYKVSSLGRVKNVTNGRVLVLHDDGRGYWQVGLPTGGGKKSLKVHRLVCAARYKVGDRFVTRHGEGTINRIIPAEALYLFAPDAEVKNGKYRNGGGYHITDEELDAAQGIEARSGETREAGLDPKDESPVAESDVP